jgi:hypothetical protein
LWVTYLASTPRNLKLATCKVYLSALIHRHVEMGLANPLADAPPLLDRILAGIKRATSQATKPKLPITTTILQAMRAHIDLQYRRDSLLWAMLWTAMAGMLRISEFTHRDDGDSDRILRTRQLTLFDHSGNRFSLTDTDVRNVRYAILHLVASKTDPLRGGVDVPISSPTALQALLTYGRHRRASVPWSQSSPLFQFVDGSPVTRGWLMRCVNDLLVRIGRDPHDFSSHSFRKGGATSLQERGVEDSLIRRSGRWKSDAFHLYVQHASLDSLIAANALL